MARNGAGVDTAVGERGKMRLLMESVPREHEKRTLSAHLQCTGVYVCMLVLESMQEANVKPFSGASHLK